MRKRVQRRKRQRIESCIARGDEPPDPISIATVAAAAIGAGATIYSASKAPDVPEAPAPPPTTSKPPSLDPEDRRATMIGKPKLKPGQKVNSIYTGPQGVLSPASTGRNTLLGG